MGLHGKGIESHGNGTDDVNDEILRGKASGRMHTAAVVVFGRGLEPVRHEDVHAAFVVPTHADRRRVLAEAFPEGERRVHVLWLAARRGV